LQIADVLGESRRRQISELPGRFDVFGRTLPDPNPTTAPTNAGQI
jgi:hypothetical protein